jgi:hypothetical protein
MWWGGLGGLGGDREGEGRARRKGQGKRNKGERRVWRETPTKTKMPRVAERIDGVYYRESEA